MRMKRQGLMGTRVWYLAINVIILHLLQGSVSEAGCPTNIGIHRPTKQRNGVCYVFFQTTKTWDNARNACHSKGGYLVIIPDSSTQDFLVASLHSLTWSRRNVWIGATDGDEEGQWIWEGTGVRLSYENWSPNQIRQPSAGRSGSKETRSNDREDCAQIRMLDAGRWHDFPCNVSSSYICQFGSVSRPTTTKQVRTTHATRVATHRTHGRTVTSTAKVASTHPSTTVKAAATSKRTLTTVRAVATSKRTMTTVRAVATSKRTLTTVRAVATSKRTLTTVRAVATSKRTMTTVRAVATSKRTLTTVKTAATSQRTSVIPTIISRHSATTRNRVPFAQSSKTPLTVRPLTSSSKTRTQTFTSSPSTASSAKAVHSTTSTPRTSFRSNSTPSTGSPSSSLHPKPENTTSKSSVRIITRASFTTSKFAVRTVSTSNKATSLRAGSATTATSHRTAPSTHTVAGKPAFTLPAARTSAPSSTSHSTPKRETKLTQAAGGRSPLSSRTTTAHYGPRRTARPPAVPHNNHLHTTRSTHHRGEALSKEWKGPGTVAGIVLGSLFGVVVIVAAVYIIWRKSNPRLRFPDHDVAFENYSYGSSVLLKTDTHSSSFS